MLKKEKRMKSVDAFPKEDGFYIDGTIRDHENESLESHTWGIKDRDIEVLDYGHFIRFGEYAVVSERLRKFIPQQLWPKILFLHNI